MNLSSYIVLGALLVILAFIIRHLYREKKKGNHCIGCSYSSGCDGHCKK